MQRTPARMPRPLAGLTWRNAGRESLAGVTLLAIAVPLNIGYAQIAGLPATAGLYALIVPAIVYALLVSSGRRLAGCCGRRARGILRRRSGTRRQR